MVLGRAVMGPLMVLAAWRGVAGWVLGAAVIAMLVDDIVDGVVARRWGLDSASLRLSDSCADTIFYLGTVGALWLRSPASLRSNWVLIATVFGMEALRYLFDLVKFRKAASYHSYLAKLWGLVLASAIVCVLVKGEPNWPITAAAILGIVVNLEGLAMSLVLPHWQNDVKTLWIAIRIREAAALAAGAER
jgi:phosphatidylglycerophosphate synthase